jgi:magnesium chelatase subunit I
MAKKPGKSPHTSATSIRVMPYSMFVGQDQLKLALELSFIAPKIGGVLLSGERGTGKSTLVRAFAQMVHGRLPVTLPINATEDRVVGGWDIGALLKGEEVRQPGLLEEADGSILYIDEVNLLDDHIVNIILDTTATGLLVIEREGRDELVEVRFTLIGTMNPSEGGLRPQLLDRFGLMVSVAGEQDETVRTAILQAVLDYDAAAVLERAGIKGEPRQVVERARATDRDLARALKRARDLYPGVQLPPEIAARCARLGKEMQGEGHRADYVIAMAARAHAVRRSSRVVEPEDIAAVARLALQHRRREAQARGDGAAWTEGDDHWVERITTRGDNAAPQIPPP